MLRQSEAGRAGRQVVALSGQDAAAECAQLARQTAQSCGAEHLWRQSVSTRMRTLASGRKRLFHSNPMLSMRRKLDYYCRLDTDSRIDSPLRDDIFDYMAVNQLHYGRVPLTASAR